MNILGEWATFVDDSRHVMSGITDTCMPVFIF